MRALQRPIAPHRRARGVTRVNPDERVWLFDLDNTLHDSSKSIFQIINLSMTQAVMDTLDVDLDTANTLRSQYWKRYGATVIGLVRHHGVKAQTFLDRCHAFDVPAHVHSEKGLAYKFGRLKGRKILLTNAPLKYAREVLHTLGILQHFESLWAIDQMCLQGCYRPKPSLSLMKQVLARLDVPASRVILVEDTLCNLKSARQVGMKTVHIFHPGTPFSNLSRGRDLYVDLRVNSLGALLTGGLVRSSWPSHAMPPDAVFRTHS